MQDDLNVRRSDTYNRKHFNPDSLKDEKIKTLIGEVESLTFQLDIALTQNKSLIKKQGGHEDAIRKVELNLIAAKKEIATLKQDLRREQKRSEQLEFKLNLKHVARKHIEGVGFLDPTMIINTITSYKKVSRADLKKTRSRKQEIVDTKFLICYFIALYTDVHFDDASEMVTGKRDHTFVCHGRDKAMEFIEFDPQFRKSAEDIAVLLGIGNIF